jgi:two-component system NtrC family sensor kinase
MGTNKSNTPYYKSLTRNMVLTVIVVSFTPMILVGGVIYNQFHDSYHEKAYAHLEVLVKKHKQNINNFLREKLSDIRFFAALSSFEELSDEASLEKRLVALRKEYGNVFEDLGVVNGSGIQIAYAGPFKLVKADYSDADWFNRALKSDYFISDVFLGLRGLPHFIIAVRQKRDGKEWILRTTVNFMTFNEVVENLRIGKTGTAFILNQKGELQTRSDFDVETHREVWNDILKTLAQEEKAIHLIEKETDASKKEIYVATFLKNRDWVLVYQQDEATRFPT